MIKLRNKNLSGYDINKIQFKIRLDKKTGRFYEITLSDSSSLQKKNLKEKVNRFQNEKRNNEKNLFFFKLIIYV